MVSCNASVKRTRARTWTRRCCAPKKSFSPIRRIRPRISFRLDATKRRDTFPAMFRLICFAIWICFAAFSLRAAESDTAALIAKGKLLYLQNCVICHQGSGQGSPGTFPPLAKSDYLMAKEENGIRAVVEGLSGRITVNGSNYNNTMPPVLLTDEQVAAVLTFVRNTWGNTSEAINVKDVSAVRAKSRFKTYAELKAAADYAPLPKAPEGFAIREVARFTENPIKLALKPGGRDLYM